MWSGYENVTTTDDMSFEFLDSEKAALWGPAATKVSETPSWPRSWAHLYTFYSCLPTGRRGPTCIFWADLTPFSLKGSLWLHGFFKFDWRDTYIKVDSITKNGKGWSVTRDNATKPQYPFTPGCRFCEYILVS